MADAIAVLNAGSSSLKFSLFVAARRASSSWSLRGQAEGSSRRRVRRQGRRRQGAVDEKAWGEGTTARARRRARPPGRRSCARSFAGHRLAAVGHRVVHGGPEYSRPMRVDRTAARGAREVRAARAAAPAAQPGADPRCWRSAPPLPQVACFDTAFHRSQPEVAQAFALPREDHRARRAALRLPRPVLRVHRAGAAGIDARAASGQTVVLHLGNGAEHVRDRRRPQHGEHDGLHRGRTACRWARAAATSIRASCSTSWTSCAWTRAPSRSSSTSESGLLGVSGISSDMRTLLGERRAAREGRDRPLRLPHRPRAGLAGGGAGRARRGRLHRRHRRDTARSVARARLPRRGVAGRRARRRRPMRNGGPRISTAASRVAGVGDPDQRGADDRAAHARRCSRAERNTHDQRHCLARC